MGTWSTAGMPRYPSISGHFTTTYNWMARRSAEVAAAHSKRPSRRTSFRGQPHRVLQHENCTKRIMHTHGSRPACRRSTRPPCTPERTCTSGLRLCPRLSGCMASQNIRCKRERRAMMDTARGGPRVARQAANGRPRTWTPIGV